MHKFAVLSKCGKYRYFLSRVWDETKPILMYIMLNPSTADATIDDPTILRCIDFAKKHSYGAIYVCNLFAFRATDPKELKRVTDPKGEENDNFLYATRSMCKDVVFAWGSMGDYYARGHAVSLMFSDAFCFGKTKNGHPKHPLYLKGDTPLQPF